MTEITEIILHENEIGDTNWKKLINLERLNLSNNKLKNFDMKTLPPSLEEIDLGDNRLKDLNL
jgi:Leucine-rich repeat (LRR) protein